MLETFYCSFDSCFEELTHTSSTCPVKIAVEAATVNMKHNVAVGIIPGDLEEVSPFVPGTRVAALYSSPLQRIMPITRAVKIPLDFDAGEVAAVLSAFVPALSIINFGRKKNGERRLLVNAEENPNSQRIKNIFHLAKIKRITGLYFRSKNYGCRSNHPPGIKSDDGDLMDVIIDLAGEESIGGRLSPGGRLIFCSFDDSMSLKVSKWKMALVFGGYVFDFESITLDEANVVFLLDELGKRRLRPAIACYTRQTKYQSGVLESSGAIICEPWKAQVNSSR